MDNNNNKTEQKIKNFVNNFSRRNCLKWGVIGVLVALPFGVHLFKKKSKSLPTVNEYEIVIKKPVGTETDFFLPSKNTEDRKLLGMETSTLGDVEISEIVFSQDFENSFTIRIIMKFVSQVPNPNRNYKFQLIAYNKDGNGVAYIDGTTKDLRTIDLDIKKKNSKSKLVRESKTRPVYSLDIDINRKEYLSIEYILLSCECTGDNNFVKI
ncbi:MAG: hypothetical protein LBC20_10105 [Planctomycetaceae bacterium]|nr:hypothetical protein [Planctomycetaceae bacterium]